MLACAPAPNEGPEESTQSDLTARQDSICNTSARTACLINSARSSRTITINYPTLSFCQLHFLASNMGLEQGLGDDLEISVPDPNTGAQQVITGTMTEDGYVVTLPKVNLYQTDVTGG